MRAARQPRFRVGANGFEIKLAGVAADQRSADRFFVGHRGLTAYGAPPALCPMRANPNCASGRFRTEGKLFQLASLAGPMSCGQGGTARPLDSTIKVATLFHRLHQHAAVAGFGIYVPYPDSQ